jgi:hypothetical protein
MHTQPVCSGRDSNGGYLICASRGLAAVLH